MESEAQQDAPSTPRPAQDALWLERLQQEGISTFLPDTQMPPPAFILSLQQLSQGHYWEAHESLEAIWLDTPYPLKLFYYALIKLAVGLLHLERRNQGAATSQLGPAIQYLSPFTPAFLGLQTDTLMKEAADRLALLRSTDSRDTAKMWEEIENLPRMAFRRVSTPGDRSQTM